MGAFLFGLDQQLDSSLASALSPLWPRGAPGALLLWGLRFIVLALDPTNKPPPPTQWGWALWQLFVNEQTPDHRGRLGALRRAYSLVQTCNRD